MREALKREALATVGLLVLLTGLGLGGCWSREYEDIETADSGGELGELDLDADAEIPPDETETVPDLVPDEVELPPLSCVTQGFEAVSGEARSHQAGAVTVVELESAATEPLDELEIELWVNRPTTGSYALGEPYDKCVACVLLYQNCSGTSCGRTLLAESGTLVVDSWTPPTGESNGGISAHLVDVRLRPISLSGTSSTFIEGDGWCIDSLAFQLAVAPTTP